MVSNQKKIQMVTLSHNHYQGGDHTAESLEAVQGAAATKQEEEEGEEEVNNEKKNSDKK